MYTVPCFFPRLATSSARAVYRKQKFRSEHCCAEEVVLAVVVAVVMRLVLAVPS